MSYKGELPTLPVLSMRHQVWWKLLNSHVRVHYNHWLANNLWNLSMFNNYLSSIYPALSVVTENIWSLHIWMAIRTWQNWATMRNWLKLQNCDYCICNLTTQVHYIFKFEHINVCNSVSNYTSLIDYSMFSNICGWPCGQYSHYAHCV